VENATEKYPRGPFSLGSPAAPWLSLPVVPLSHRDLGGAGRPPLVLLHGMLGAARNWQSTGRDLAEHYHVFALDARNHGASPHHSEMTYPAMAADLLGWLDAQGITRTTIVGHSMGGKTAMLFACRHPERVERLVVVDMAPVNYFWPGHRDEFAAMVELDLAAIQSHTDAEREFRARIADPGMRRFLAANLAKDAAGGWRWQINLPVLVEALDDMERNPLAPADRFDGPTRFIAGGRSRYVQATDEAAIRHHFPAATIATIPDCGHNPHMESRAEFVRLFLNA
jgi:pimeloyl-ACP methyl ester carboxylesterase